jgi:hypothetical protein
MHASAERRILFGTNHFLPFVNRRYGTSRLMHDERVNIFAKLPLNHWKGRSLDDDTKSAVRRNLVSAAPRLQAKADT